MNPISQVKKTYSYVQRLRRARSRELFLGRTYCARHSSDGTTAGEMPAIFETFDKLSVYK